MRMTTEQKSAARAAIIVAAGRRFREAGFAGIGIDALAAASGQTSGAIYAHFQSKTDVFDAVVREGMGRLIAGIRRVEAAAGPQPWAGLFAERYLSVEHRDAVADGCILPSLSADIARAPAELKMFYEHRLNEAATVLAEGFPGSNKSNKAKALALLSLVAGSLLLSRAASGVLADDILHHAREAASDLINGRPASQAK